MATQQWNVSFKEIPSRHVVCIRKQAREGQVGSVASACFMNLMVYLEEKNAKKALCGRPYQITHSINDEQYDIEMCLPINVSVPSRGEIKCREEPKIKAASLLVKGSYNQLDDATAFLTQYVQKHHKQMGPLHTVYIVGPAETKDSANFQTELFIPIQ